MRLDTARKGRWLARTTLFRLERSGSEACRFDRTSQAVALRASLEKLLRIGTSAAIDGYARLLTDALGARPYCQPGELARLYERAESEQRIPKNDSAGRTGDNVPEQTTSRNGNRIPRQG